jgi:glycosyltransferase involved in cell wall biosynthesis
MPNRPLVSVILLNYNHGHFIEEAFRALAQALSQEDELIVIDDASQDDSVATIQQLRPLFSTLQLVAHARNQGVVAGMNEGLRLATREYIYFAAADDRVMPNLFEASLTMFAAHPEAALCTARARIIDNAGTDLGLLKTPVVDRSPRYLSSQEVAMASYRDDNWLVGCSTIYRRDFLLAAGGFRPELGSFCDGFASRLLAFEHGACFIPDALSCWRRMSEGYSQSETADRERVEQIADNSLTLFKGTYRHIFSPQYADRWQRRWIFGARAHALYKERISQTRELKRLAQHWKPSMAAAMNIPVTIAWATKLIFLFMRMRPFDLWPTFWRRLNYLGKSRSENEIRIALRKLR